MLNIISGNGLLPVGTNPLPETIDCTIYQYALAMQMLHIIKDTPEGKVSQVIEAWWCTCASSKSIILNNDALLPDVL